MKMADKNKFALWMYPETLERVEKLYREDGCKSRSEFIEKAINFYCGYLTAENYKEYFPEVIAVSYTHLDVYKRQILRNIRAR